MDAKYAQQFKKGSLEMILLCIINEKETYGYEIISKLNETGGNVFRYTREGTVYPILYRMEEAGLIRHRLVPAAANGGTKKYYSITEDGKATLQEMIVFWGQYVECVNAFLVTEKEEGTTENDR